jgi:hypothetical protein
MIDAAVFWEPTARVNPPERKANDRALERASH